MPSRVATSPASMARFAAQYRLAFRLPPAWMHWRGSVPGVAGDGNVGVKWNGPYLKGAPPALNVNSMPNSPFSTP